MLLAAGRVTAQQALQKRSTARKNILANKADLSVRKAFPYKDRMRKLKFSPCSRQIAVICACTVQVFSLQGGSQVWCKSLQEIQDQCAAQFGSSMCAAFSSWHFGVGVLTAFGCSTNDSAFKDQPVAFVQIALLDSSSGAFISCQEIPVQGTQFPSGLQGCRAHFDPAGTFMDTAVSPPGNLLAIPLWLYPDGVVPTESEPVYQKGIVLVLNVEMMSMQMVIQGTGANVRMHEYHQPHFSWCESMLLAHGHLLHIQTGHSINLDGKEVSDVDEEVFDKTGRFLGFDRWSQRTGSKSAVILDSATGQELFKVPDHFFMQFLSAEQSALVYHTDGAGSGQIWSLEQRMLLRTFTTGIGAGRLLLDDQIILGLRDFPRSATILCYSSINSADEPVELPIHNDRLVHTILFSRDECVVACICPWAAGNIGNPDTAIVRLIKLA